jgi:peptidoglycan/xylan/chitin deacetylase (PgdA/CDA1 family)
VDAYAVKAALTRARSAAWLLRAAGRHPERGVRIVMYHRVSDARDQLAVTPRRFREQMELLASEGYRVVGVSEAADLAASGELPERTLGLTFDDGYRDVAVNALPVLAEYGFRATVFVATGVTDGRRKFDWYREQPPVLGWDEVVGLDRAGTLEFEAHTVTHPNLLALDDEAAGAEIWESKGELEEHLGRPVTVFAYPAGLFGERERRLVGAAGFRFAVSCEPGLNGPATHPLALRRRQIDARDSLLDFRAKIEGGHDKPLPLRALYRRRRYGMEPDMASCAS